MSTIRQFFVCVCVFRRGTSRYVDYSNSFALQTTYTRDRSLWRTLTTLRRDAHKYVLCELLERAQCMRF